MSYLLENMNDRQKQAIQHTQGPLLVMAGAGSGKTRVLTHRIAYLIEEENVNPWQVLAITFTNKAAREMKERLEVLIGATSKDMWVSTFHAMCVRILRREADLIGYSKQFTIIDTGEQKTLMKRIMTDLNFDSQKFSDKMILASISDAKNQMITPEMMKASSSSYIEDIISDCYVEYQKRLNKNQLFDFDDLIMKTVQLFKERPDVLETYQRKFQYIHVDEYQDTNRAQYELVLQLSHLYQNICVVGDADQSIYGWRGADMSNILNFHHDFPKATTILLEQNYRSTQTILNAANSVIANNQERVAKKLWTENEKGDLITFHRAFSEQDEASYVAQTIKHSLQQKNIRQYDEVAILYRTNAQSRNLEEALMKQAIPYKIVGGLRFYDRAEIKDMLAYLRLVANPDDDLSFERVVNVPKRSVGKTSVEKLRQFSIEHDISLFKAAQNVLATSLTGKAQKGVAQFVRIIETLQQYAQEHSITELFEKIMTLTEYVEILEAENTLEAESRIQNIQEFLSVTKEFDKREDLDAEQSLLSQFLTEFALDGAVPETSDDGVTLMTLHAAKGLEFPIVFIVGMEETIFPSSRSVFEDDVEEERRLMYVGITRAEKKLYLTNTTSRLLYGKTQRNPQSRFLEEIAKEYIDTGVQPTVKKQQSFVKKTVTVAYTEQEAVSWRVGEQVSHKKWGIGRIVRVTGEGTDTMLDIAFDGQGIKTLLASYAPIEKVK